MSEPHPNIVVLAGPNGAGKSTAAPALLQGALGVTEFVDADVIARGLSAFDADRAAVAAGRVMLARLRELSRRRLSFAFETTLATRSLARWLGDVKDVGYLVDLVFLWRLPSEELAVQRVRDRVRRGGHSVPSDTIRRRYKRGLLNFFRLYEALASTWRLYDSSGAEPRLVSERLNDGAVTVYDERTWAVVRKQGAEDEG